MFVRHVAIRVECLERRYRIASGFLGRHFDRRRHWLRIFEIVSLVYLIQTVFIADLVWPDLNQLDECIPFIVDRSRFRSSGIETLECKPGAVLVVEPRIVSNEQPQPGEVIWLAFQYLGDPFAA